MEGAAARPVDGVVVVCDVVVVELPPVGVVWAWSSGLGPVGRVFGGAAIFAARRRGDGRRDGVEPWR